MTPADAPPKPRRLSRADRQEQLLNVADRLFTTRGYEQTKIEDVCQAAGVSRPVIYDHFGSKENLYLACVSRVRQQYEDDLQQVFQETSDPREQLRRAADVYFGMVESDPDRWLLLYGGAAVPVTGELGQLLQDLRAQTHRLTLRHLQAHLKEQPVERLEAVAVALSGVFEQLGLWWLRQPGMARAQIVDWACDLCWPIISALWTEVEARREIP